MPVSCCGIARLPCCRQFRMRRGEWNCNFCLKISLHVSIVSAHLSPWGGRIDRRTSAQTSFWISEADKHSRLTIGRLHALFAASRLKNRHNLRDVVRQGHRAYLALTSSTSPELASAPLEELPNDAFSASAIGRFQIYADAALCSHTRNLLLSEFASGPIFMFADLSPLHGTDWLLSTMLLISADDLLRAMDAAQILRRTF